MMEITLMKKSRAFNLVVFACMLSFAFVATFYETVHAADNVFVKGARVVGIVLAVGITLITIVAVGAGAFSIGGLLIGAGVLAAISSLILIGNSLLASKKEYAKEAVSPYGAAYAQKSERITDNVQAPPVADSVVAANNLSQPAEIIPNVAAPAKDNISLQKQALKNRQNVVTAYQNYVFLLNNNRENTAEIAKAYEQYKHAEVEYHNYAVANPEVNDFLESLNRKEGYRTVNYHMKGE